MHTYIHTQQYFTATVPTYIQVYIYIYIYTYIYICIYAYTYTTIFLGKCIQLRTHGCVAHIHTYTYMHIYIHTQRYFSVKYPVAHAWIFCCTHTYLYIYAHIHTYTAIFLGNCIQLRMHGCRLLNNECSLSVRVSSCTGGDEMNVNEYAQVEMVGCEVQGRLWAQGVYAYISYIYIYIYIYIYFCMFIYI